MAERKVISACQLTNNHFIAVHEIEHGIEDTIKFSANNKGKVFEETIKYKRNGDAYFSHGEHEIFLNELIRYDLWRDAE